MAVYIQIRSVGGNEIGFDHIVTITSARPALAHGPHRRWGHTTTYFGTSHYGRLSHTLYPLATQEQGDKLA
jgi:hypothetical protein